MEPFHRGEEKKRSPSPGKPAGPLAGSCPISMRLAQHSVRKATSASSWSNGSNRWLVCWLRFSWWSPFEPKMGLPKWLSRGKQQPGCAEKTHPKRESHLGLVGQFQTGSWKTKEQGVAELGCLMQTECVAELGCLIPTDCRESDLGLVGQFQTKQLPNKGKGVAKLGCL